MNVERKRGSGFKRVGSATALQEAGEAVVTLPKGTQTLRAVARVGSETVTSPEVKVKVRAARRWSTTKKDTGAYRGKAGSRSVKFKVAKRGRELRSFKAFVPMTCPGVDPGRSRPRSAPPPSRRSGSRPTAASSPPPRPAPTRRCASAAASPSAR